MTDFGPSDAIKLAEFPALQTIGGMQRSSWGMGTSFNQRNDFWGRWDGQAYFNTMIDP